MVKKNPTGTEIVDPDSLADIHSRRKADKQARLDSIKQGRLDRPAFGTRKRGKERSSVPNAEKAKKSQPAMMIVHKGAIRAKAFRSAKEKRNVQRAHKIKQKRGRH